MNLKDSIDLFCQYPVHKRHEIAGMKISIETPKGHTRSGTDKDGHEWSIKMKNDYGYIRMTEGTDGDHVDCYIGPNHEAKMVYVIHQLHPDSGEYDEDKCMIGFDSAEEAKAAYLAHYDKPGFFGSMDEMPIDDFREAVHNTKGVGEMLEAAGAAGAFATGSIELGSNAPFHPPSLKKPQYVPADTPMETDDRFLDVTRRHAREVEKFRARLTSKKGQPMSIERVGNAPVQESFSQPYGTIYVGRR